MRGSWKNRDPEKDMKRSKAALLKVWSGNPRGFLWSLRSNDLHINTKTLFFTLNLSQMYSGFFQSVPAISHRNRLNAEPDIATLSQTLKYL